SLVLLLVAFHPLSSRLLSIFFPSNHTATTQLYTLSLHDALPISTESHLSPHVLEDIESEVIDPSASLLEALAAAMKIPPAWLFSHPTSFHTLFDDPEENTSSTPTGPDPVTERILSGSQMDRSLYVLLT